MNKHIRAMAAAIIITGILGAAILWVGVGALTNPNAVQAKDTANQAAPDVDASTTTVPTTSNGTDQSQIVTQLKAQLDQANQTIDQANTQLDQANQTIQQYQQLLVALQQRGVIRINQDGSISIPRRGG